MFGRTVLICAAVLYVAIMMGCVISAARSDRTQPRVAAPVAQPPRPRLDGLPFRGVGMQIQRVDWIDQYKQNIDEITELGADTVLLVVDARQENAGSSRIYLDMRMTPTAEQLGALIQHAKSKNLRVVLMPIVLLDNPRKDTEWRGTIQPEAAPAYRNAWDEWFDSYRAMMSHFAWVAQANGVDVLVVGSELVSTESNLDQWTKTIREIRNTFRGLLTYSANWDHYVSIPFWDQLDLIAMNSYYKLGEGPQVTVEQIQKRWAEIQKDQIAFVKKMNKPLLFTEVGWCNLANAAHEPWDYTRTEVPIDLDLQKRLYEGFFRSWHGHPNLGGFMIWEWTCGDGGPKNRGYTPEGKPAEAVLRQWLAKPPWAVK